MTGAVARPIRGVVQAPTEGSRDFMRSAIRLVRQLTPQRTMAVTVVLLGVGGIGITVVGPRILGHATDLLFNGVIGRQLPAGLTKEQAVAAARARGDDTFADLLAGTNVMPGHGVDFGAVGRTLLLALGLYLIAALLIWLQARLLNVAVQRTMVALRSDVEDKLHRMPLSYFDSRQRGEVLSRVTNDVDNIQTSLSMTISQLMTSVLTVVAVLVMMLSISSLLTLLTIVTVPLSLWATRVIARRSQRHVRRPMGQHRPPQRPHRGDVQRFHHRQDVRSPRPRAGAVPPVQRRRVPDELWCAVLFGSGRAGDGVHRQHQLRRGGGGRRHPGRDGPDHPRQHPGVHPVRPPVQPATDAGRRHVQHAAVRRSQRGAGIRTPRRRGGVSRPARDTGLARSAARPGPSSGMSASAIGQAHRSSRTCHWWPNRA